MRKREIERQSRYDALVAEHKRLAKKADRMLRNIEKYSKQKGFKGMKKYAYASAMQELKAWKPKGQRKAQKRFDIKPPADMTELKKKIAVMKNFIESPTATKRGVIEGYKKRVEAFNKTMNEGRPPEEWVNFTWQEFADMIESKGMKKITEKNRTIDRSMNYRPAVRMVYKKLHPRWRPSKAEAIEAAQSNKKIEDSINKEVETELKNNGLSLDDLYRKPLEKKSGKKKKRR